jgi:hypothetical protein
MSGWTFMCLDKWDFPQNHHERNQFLLKVQTRPKQPAYTLGRVSNLKNGPLESYLVDLLYVNVKPAPDIKDP